VLVGRVARAHGNRGQVIVNPETDFPEERFRPGQALLARAGTETRRLVVTSVRFQRGRPVIGLDGVETMDDAEALAGTELRIPESELLPLPEGTFYHHDLVGCDVQRQDGTTIGRVTRVEGSAAGSLLVVQTRRGEVLIPLAADICVSIEPQHRRIVVEPPEGLLEVNRTRL
jgi:16S rRNA processing protein RimM